MGWGWCLSDETDTHAVELDVLYADGIEQVIPCLTNRARDDVARAFQDNPLASTAGFIFLSRLASTGGVQSASLVISFADGTRERCLLTGFPERFSPDSITTQSVFTRFRKIWHLARAGKISYLIERLKGAIKRTSQRLRSTATSGQLPKANVELMFDHQLGGGANKFRDEKIAQILRTGNEVVLITFELPRLLYRLEIHRSLGKHHETLEHLDAVQLRLAQTHYSTIHINDFVSYPDPHALLQLIKLIQKRDQSQIALYLHDYYFVCPSYTLINAEGRYCGIPDKETCRNCLKTNKEVFPSFEKTREIAPWRDAWDELLRAATSIVAFSESTVNIFLRAFPQNTWHEKISIQPHLVDKSRYPKVRAPHARPLKIAIIGNISFAKGAKIVHDLVVLVAKEKLPIRIVVIGTLERLTISPVLTVTGAFENSSLPRLLEQHGIGVCLLPSICPETFSYVTEEIMTMEMPLVCFDLGAPADRVKRYRLGEVAKKTSAQGALDAVMLLTGKLATAAQ